MAGLEYMRTIYFPFSPRKSHKVNKTVVHQYTHRGDSSWDRQNLIRENAVLSDCRCLQANDRGRRWHWKINLSFRNASCGYNPNPHIIINVRSKHSMNTLNLSTAYRMSSYPSWDNWTLDVYSIKLSIVSTLLNSENNYTTNLSQHSYLQSEIAVQEHSE